MFIMLRLLVISLSVRYKVRAGLHPLCELLVLERFKVPLSCQVQVLDGPSEDIHIRQDSGPSFQWLLTVSEGGRHALQDLDWQQFSCVFL